MSWKNISDELPPENMPVLLRTFEPQEGNCDGGFIEYKVDYHSMAHCWEGRSIEPLYFSDTNFYEITHWKHVDVMNNERFCKSCDYIFKPLDLFQVDCELCKKQNEWAAMQPDDDIPDNVVSFSKANKKEPCE